MHWRTGDTVAWRVRVRIEPEHPEGEVGIVFPAIVVRDTSAEVAVYTAPGAIAKRRNHESGGPHGRVVLGVRDGYEDVVWRRWRRLLLRGPADGHAISLFWDDETDAVRFWYIDLVTPLHRTAAGFEFVDHGIDVVVQPDLSSWEWKDADELEWYVEHGRYTRSEADHIRAEGERAVARLRRERGRYEEWLSWRPDAGWSVPALPDGWVNEG